MEKGLSLEHGKGNEVVVEDVGVGVGFCNDGVVKNRR